MTQIIGQQLCLHLDRVSTDVNRSPIATQKKERNSLPGRSGGGLRIQPEPGGGCNCNGEETWAAARFIVSVSSSREEVS